MPNKQRGQMIAGIVLSLVLALSAPAFASSALPDGFVYLRDVAPSIVQDIRYAGSHNFVGRPIKGYLGAECILTAPAAMALARLQNKLAGQGLSLIVWDCYRPMRAVADFLRWSKDPADAEMKAGFYPRVDKQQLFAFGYLATRSAHSRGSTVDLGLVPLASPTPDPARRSGPCPSARGTPIEDGGIDLGTGHDCLDAASSTSNALVGATARRNRRMLTSAMQAAGFRPYFREWWHFELIGEPFHHGFDFAVSAAPAREQSR